MKTKLWEVFWTFFKVGAFTFGGGYAMIPLIQHEIVDIKGYISEKEFMNIIAIAETTPGVIAVNTATFVGYKVCGVFGGIIATLGVVLPSFVIISIISRFYLAFRSIQWIDWAFSGIQAGVLVLICGAMIRMSSKSEKNFFTVSIMIIAFFIAAFSKINITLVIVLGAFLGLVRNLIICRNQKDQNDLKSQTEEAAK